MPLVRIIKDGVFIEENVRVDTDDTPEVSDEIAKLLYSRNWAVPYFKEDDFVVQEVEQEVNESTENSEVEQTDESVDLRPTPRRR